MSDTLKIRLLTARAGPGFSQRPGEEIVVGAAEAGRMIAAGQAEALDPDPAPKPAPKPARKKRETARAEPAAEIRARTRPAEGGAP